MSVTFAFSLVGAGGFVLGFVVAIWLAYAFSGENDFYDKGDRE